MCWSITRTAASDLATAIAFDEASGRAVDLIALHAWGDADWPDFPDVEWSAVKETLAERPAGWQERYLDVHVRRIVVFDYPPAICRPS